MYSSTLSLSIFSLGSYEFLSCNKNWNVFKRIAMEIGMFLIRDASSENVSVDLIILTGNNSFLYFLKDILLLQVSSSC